MRELLRQKDIIIDNQTDLIISLKEQINLLKERENNVNSRLSIRAEGVASSRSAKVNRQKSVSSASKSQSENSAEPVLMSKTVNENFKSLEDATRKKFQEVINLTKEGGTDSAQSLQDQVVKHSSRVKSYSAVMGSKVIDKTSSIKAAVDYASVHVSKLHPDTGVEDLKSYLIADFPEVEAEKLNSAYPTLYSSFRVSVCRENLQRAMDPTVWPRGVRIDEFFLNKRRKYQTSRRYGNTYVHRVPSEHKRTAE